MVLLQCLTVWTTFYFGEWRNAAWLSEKYQLYCSVEEKKVVSDMNVYKQWQSFHFWVDCFKSSVDQSQAPWGCNSGWSGHLIPSTGVVAGLLHMTPTGNSLYCCDLQTQPHTSGSVTIKKTSRNLLASYIQKIIIFMFKCFYLNYKFQMTLYYVHPLSWKKNKKHTLYNDLTIKLKARIVRSPEQVYSSPLWICIPFTASWWPSKSPSVGTSSSPGSDTSDKTHTYISVVEWNINTMKEMCI